MIEESLPQYAGQPEDAFLLLLQTWVAGMIAHNPEQLRQVLYRVDVSESDAGLAALGQEPATTLAQLLLLRQKQKWESRKQHSMHPTKDEDPELLW